MITRVFTISAVAIGLLGGALSTAQDVSSSPSRTYVQFAPLDTLKVKQGQTLPLQFTFHVKTGYHINSNQPTEPEMIPTSLSFTPPPDLVIGKVEYPAGELTSFPFDPTQKLSVYAGDVVVKAVITTQPKAPLGTYTVHGELKYQACDDNACYPPKGLPVQFDVKVSQVNVSARRDPFIGTEAPDFELKVLDARSKTLKLSDFKGKAVLVNFWATWCEPCKVEMPWLVDLQKKYGADGFQIVGIAMDKTDEKTIASFVHKMGINYPIVMGTEKVGDLYGGVEGMPTLFFVDRSGKIVAHELGLRSRDVIESNVKKFVGEGEGGASNTASAPGASNPPLAPGHTRR